MKRLEIFANQSVQEEIIKALESQQGMRYTVIPVVQGKGLTDWKLGTTVWPEENFLLITYLEDAEAQRAVADLQKIKDAFPVEGIRFFTMTVD